MSKNRHVDWIEVAGFRSIRSLKLELREANVIIGPNGSGKSNFIELFKLLHSIRQGTLEQYVANAGGADEILHFGAGATSKMSIHISFNQGTDQYSIELQASTDNRLTPTSEAALYWGDRDKYSEPGKFIINPASSTEAGISQHHPHTPSPAAVEIVQRQLEKFCVFHFHDTSRDAPLRQETTITDDPVLQPDGNNIAAVLHNLREVHAPHYTYLRETIQLVAPFFDDFVLEPSGKGGAQISLEWRQVNSDKIFSAKSLSDGTLRFIAIATLLLQPEEDIPPVVLIDEPELGLHPYAIAMLATLLQSAAVEKQFIVATQSPRLVDYFQPENIIVADRVAGATEFTHPKSKILQELLHEFSLGQLWEMNELGGRPRYEQ